MNSAALFASSRRRQVWPSHLAAGSLLVALVGAVSSLATPKPAREPTLAVLDLNPASPADEAFARVTSDALTAAIASSPAAEGWRVLGATELHGVVTQAARTQLVGCDDDRCAIDVAKAVAADEIVVGRVGVVGNQALLFLSRISPETARVSARASAVIPLQGGAVPSASASASVAAAQSAAASLMTPKVRQTLTAAALSLLDPTAAKGSGDENLKDLRLAVVFDEFGVDGQALRLRPVETCAQKLLLQEGATVVSPSVVAHIKGVAGPRAILDGGVPPGLSSDEVDALLVGVVEYNTGAGFAGATSVEADLSMSLLKVDTGDVLASEQQQARHPGHTVNAAQKGAAGRVCAELAGRLKSAIAGAATRGQRVVVTVKGADTTSAELVLGALKGTKRVGTARLTRLNKTEAILDVIVAGGDGIALALTLGGAVGGRSIVEASAGAITLGLPSVATTAGP